jgi:hypothetical protein
MAYKCTTRARASTDFIVVHCSATQAKADAREAAYAKAVKAYQDEIAAKEAAYVKAVLGK